MKLQELIKIERKLQKPYTIDYNLLVAQDLWQALHQILLIILLKEFIKLNVNTNTMIKNVKLAYKFSNHGINKFLFLLQKIHE